MVDLDEVMNERDTPDGSPEQRFTALFIDHYELVLAFARRRVEPDLAQDIVAETFLTAWRHIDDLRGEPLPWLYRVASHVISNHGGGPAAAGVSMTGRACWRATPRAQITRTQSARGNGLPQPSDP